jgi:hypothetical protein
VKEAEAVSNPTSAPKLRSLLPIAAESSKRGFGFRPILESIAAWGWRYCTSSWYKMQRKCEILSEYLGTEFYVLTLTIITSEIKLSEW